MSLGRDSTEFHFHIKCYFGLKKKIQYNYTECNFFHQKSSSTILKPVQVQITISIKEVKKMHSHDLLKTLPTFLSRYVSKGIF